MTQHDITIRRCGTGHVLELDGHPIADITESARLHIDGRSGAVLELTLAVDAGSVRTRGQVTVDEQTAAALKRLGWTPPESEH